MTEKDLWNFKSLTDKGLSNIDLPAEAILCDDVNCKNENHANGLGAYV